MSHSDSLPTTSPGPRRASATRRWLILACLLVAIGGAVYAAFWRHHLKRLAVLRPGVLYRAAQPTELGFRWMAQRHGVKTVLCLRRFREIPLGAGILDLDDQDGTDEASFVEVNLGLKFVQWPMGDEPYWPWCTPWQFEEFLRLMDDPANHPVLVHCVGGRHRTGTISALYRLEYDRWTPDQALAEMYAFEFGSPIAIQEHNLRTYLPRPHPTAEQWALLRGHFVGLLGDEEKAEYETLVRMLRQARGDSATESALQQYVRQGRPFAVALAARLIDSPDDPLAATAAAQAHALLAVEADSVKLDELATAAGVVADYGTASQQRMLAAWLVECGRSPQATAEYEAIVAGLTNRYTANRAAWLAMLLDDTRQRVGRHTAAYRYCDTAVARLSPIANKNFLSGSPTAAGWNDAVAAARQWLAEHPELQALRNWVPPDGNNLIRAGRATNVEDLSRLPVLNPN